MSSDHTAGGLLWRRTSGVVEVARPEAPIHRIPVQAGRHPLVQVCSWMSDRCAGPVRAGPRMPYRPGMTAHWWYLRCMAPNPGVEFAPVPQAADGVEELQTQLKAVADIDATVLLVRHALAGRKSDWDGPDRERPLDSVGRRQAENLRAALVWWAPERVISNDRVRCTRTVRPVAQEIGTAVELDDAFDEDCNVGDVSAALTRIRDLAGSGTAVACSQGEVIPAVVQALHEEAGIVPPPRIRARKGSTWALSFTGGTLVQADYYADFDPAA